MATERRTLEAVRYESQIVRELAVELRKKSDELITQSAELRRFLFRLRVLTPSLLRSTDEM